MDKRITVRMSEEEYKKLIDIKKIIEIETKLTLSISDIVRFLINNY